MQDRAAARVALQTITIHAVTLLLHYPLLSNTSKILFKVTTYGTGEIVLAWQTI